MTEGRLVFPEVPLFPQRVLVTGAAGFIGSHLCEALLWRGCEVVGLDNFDPAYARQTKEANVRAIEATARKTGRRFGLVEEDVREAGALARLCGEERIDTVAHLAARAGVRASLADPRGYAQVNVEGTVAVLEAARREGAAVVFASSSSVYGALVAERFEETLAPAPVSPYAASKLAAEEYCRTYHALYGLPVTCLRLFTVYGPRQRPDLAIRKFMEKLYRGEPLPVYGDGSAARDYTYVEDTVRGIVAALAGEGAGETINLGGGEPVTLGELIEALERVTGRQAEVERLPEQAGDVPRTAAEISKAKRVLGWIPQVKLEEGLRRYVEWWEGQR